MLRTIDVRVAENGRIILPAAVRKALGLQGEGKLILTLEEDAVRLTPLGHGVSRARALYQQHAKAERTTADFLADRQSDTDLAKGPRPSSSGDNG